MLTKLKSLDLSQNPLEDLQPDVFKDITVSVPKTLFPEGPLKYAMTTTLFFHLQFVNKRTLKY